MDRSEDRPGFLVSFTAPDRDWAEWVGSHLDGLGYSYELHDPPLAGGDDGLAAVDEARANGHNVVLVVSDALLDNAAMGSPFRPSSARPGPAERGALVLVQIEDLRLPVELSDGIAARMFNAPNDYHGSRDLLLAAVSQVREPVVAHVGGATKRSPLPAPVVLAPAYPVPAPAPAAAPDVEQRHHDTADAADTAADTADDAADDADGHVAEDAPAADLAPVELELVEVVEDEAPRRGAGLLFTSWPERPANGPATVESTTETERSELAPVGDLRGGDPDSEPVDARLDVMLSNLNSLTRSGTAPEATVDDGPGPAAGSSSEVDARDDEGDGDGDGDHAETGALDLDDEEQDEPALAPAARDDAGPVPPNGAICRLPGWLLTGSPVPWGREACLERLAHSSAPTQAICGPMGAGKSAVAAHHAARAARSADVVWWVRAQARAMALADLRALAVAVGLEGTDAPSLVANLGDWLASCDESWLIVFDGMDGEDITDLLPQPAPGPDGSQQRVLLTAREAPALPADAVVTLGPLSPGEAADYLQAETGSGDRSGLEAIGGLLGGWPWALRLAAAHLTSVAGQASSDRTIAAYREDLASPPQLDGFRPAADIIGAGPGSGPERADRADGTEGTDGTDGTDGEFGAGAVAAALVALRRLYEETPNGLRGFTAAAALAPLGLPRADLDALGGPGSRLAERAAKAGLVEVGDSLVAVPEPVGNVVIDLLTDPAARDAIGTALEVLDERVGGDPTASQADLYAPHARALLGGAADALVTNGATARLAAFVGTWLGRLGDHRAALAFARQAAQHAATELGVEDPFTLTARLALAELYVELGEHDAALEVQAAIVADAERVLGPEAPETLHARANLAADHLLVGDAASARAEAELAVAGLVACYGPDHHETRAAMELLEAAQAALDETAPPPPAWAGPQLGDTTENWARPGASLSAAGPGEAGVTSSDEAGPSAVGGDVDLADAAAGGDAAGWPSRPDHSEADLEDTPGNDMGASGTGGLSRLADHNDEPHLPSSEHDESTNGKSSNGWHPRPSTHASPFGFDVATTSLAPGGAGDDRDRDDRDDRDDRGDGDRGASDSAAGSVESLERRPGVSGGGASGQDDRRDTSGGGPSAEESLDALAEHASALVSAGRYNEAVDAYTELVDGRDEAHGTTDLRTLTARNDLANALALAGQHNAALELLETVVETATAAHGPSDPGTLTAKHNLANTYADLGRHQEALALRSDVLRDRELLLGASHPQTVGARNNLANSYAELGRHEEALALRSDVVATRQAVLGAGHPQTLGAMNNLANSYADLGRHEEALALREEVLASRQHVLGADHPHTLTARNNLANSYAALGRHDEALALRAQAVRDCERILGPNHPHTLTARNNLANSYAAASAAGGVGTLVAASVDTTASSGAGGADGTAGDDSETGADAKRRRFWFFWRR